jgi:DNA anti-recombination protein RmuC
MEGVSMASTRNGNTAMNDAADKIGSMLGRIAAKVDSVKRQRAEIAAELDHVISVAQRMKQDMGAAGPDLRKAGSKVSNAMTTAKRRLSPDARERIANAARKRWAAYRKAKAANKK